MTPGAERVFGDYFAIFPWEHFPPQWREVRHGLRVGPLASLRGTARGLLHCIDPSSALVVARRTHARDRLGIPLEQG